MSGQSGSRRDFLKAAVAGGAALSAGFGAAAGTACRKESFRTSEPQPLDPASIRLRGEWGSRFMAATCNLLTRPERYPIESFAANASSRPGALWSDWPGDQFGRFFSVLHIAEGYGWTPAPALRAAIADAVLPLQTAEGNFGAAGTASSDDSRIPSGNAFALRGLMDAYADTREPRYLDAARRLARYYEAAAPAWETKRGGRLHEFFGHCLDGLAALYERAGERWVLELAVRLASHAGRTPHTHHSLSLCRGLADLARVERNASHRERVEDYLAYARESLAVTGGLPESLPAYDEDEGCALADWVVVNLLMFQGTREERYLDAAEHTLVNHFFMNQFPTGGFGHRSFGREIIGGKNWQGWEGRFGSENPGCCSMWGQWGLGQAGRFIVMTAGDEILVNLYASIEVELPEKGVRIAIASDFPRSSRAVLRVHTEREDRFALKLRIPPWADGVEILRRGKPVRVLTGARRATLAAGWKDGETVEVRFRSGLHLVSRPDNNTAGFGIFEGPLCLGLPESAADVNLPWAVIADAAGRPVLDSLGRPQLAEPAGGRTSALEPICADWQYPDVRRPRLWRVLFAVKS